MSAVLEYPAKRKTCDEFCQLDNDQRDEIIGSGLLMAATAPATWNQNRLNDINLGYTP